MPLTSPEMKTAIVKEIDQLLRYNEPPGDLADILDAQSVDIQVISYNTIQIKVLPSNRNAWHYFTIKISEQQ
jgi:hypothetical protein